MARKRQPWSGEEQMSYETIITTANSSGLKQEVLAQNHWSVSDAVDELGSNRRLAEKMLDYRGMEANKKNIDSQMRSIQRWLKNERGEPGQKHKPSAGIQKLINDIGRNAAHGNKAAHIAINGDVSVNGYKRNRNIGFDVSNEDAADLIDALQRGDSEDAWEILAHSYGSGVSELHAFDADINFSWH